MKRILIANRSEIALRVMHTAHRMGMETVAVYSDADAASPHVRAATVAVALGGSASADSYLRIDKLLAAAKAANADAVHPGYGFLSENADFAQAVVDAGLVWIGPPADAIRALGSKSACKQLAQQRGVPTLPGYSGSDQSNERFADEAQTIGYPLMVKATAGGGGRGMRLVADAAQLPQALNSARAEALASFGSAELLIERALLKARHVEVQVFADQQGNCIHLGERDCSVQRRNQKIVEEAPSPAVDAALRERMGACAVALARAADYAGAGTVEFLLQDGQFYLMEMNTRLQVEHPVTEAITGLDLVAWQLQVARGERLPLVQTQVQFIGHAIEVRLCAEDEQFVPHTGNVTALRLPPHAAFGHNPNALRIDHALELGATVSPHYDSMLGKLIAHAPTRGQAIAQLQVALCQTAVGGLPTNRSLLCAVLDNTQFVSGDALVPFLAQQGDHVRQSLSGERQHKLLAAAAVWLALRNTNTWPPNLPCGFVRHSKVRSGSELLALSWQILRDGKLLAACADDELELELALGSTTNAAQGGLRACQVNCNGLTETLLLARQGVHWGHLSFDFEDASFEPPTSTHGAQANNTVQAPMNGKLVAVLVQAGQAVELGQTVAVIESMKLQHNLAAPRPGVVERVLAGVGEQVGPRQALIELVP